MRMLEKMEAINLDHVIEEFEAMTKDAKRIQLETLQKILEQNGETEYLQKWGLRSRSDPESFKACVPLVTHMEMSSYIQRIADGDASPVLTGNPITSLSLRFLLYIKYIVCHLWSYMLWSILESLYLVIWLVCSSGTTQGKPKFIPFNNELLESTMQIFQTSFAFRNR